MTRAEQPIPLCLFARAPRPGSVKTRLQPALGTQRAAAVAERMLRRSVETMAGAWPGSLVLAVTPDSNHPLFEELVDAYDLSLVLQHGADLGARMLHALEAGVAEAGCAAVVGSDVPQISGATLRQAHSKMTRGNNVLGPAADGGFYLLGLQRTDAAMFDGVRWGGSDVCEQVLRQSAALGLTFTQLPEMRDIDTPDDLVWLARKHEAFREFL
ncbi:MAG: TIGR04282 family arsenosugar biosynthesis glycosyltransferase [Pseudomonadota bacterium]|nr:TIGR04282 family arsenosugar biosynthesis glycosyltransferase [Pseudomonadota bacterium]